jgi:hypothetical protein
VPVIILWERRRSHLGGLSADLVSTMKSRFYFSFKRVSTDFSRLILGRPLLSGKLQISIGFGTLLSLKCDGLKLGRSLL